MSDLPNLDTLLIESALDFAIFAMDLSGKLVRWSRGAERVLGWTAQEALGQDARMIFTEEDRAAGIPEQEISHSLKQGASLDERWHLRKDHTRFWASGEMMALYAPDGGPAIGLMKVLRNRTEQWLSQQKALALAKLGESLANMIEPAEMAHLAADLVRSTLNAAGACYATMDRELQVDGLALAPQPTLGVEDLVAACTACLDAQRAAQGGGCVTASSGPAGAYCVIPLFESQRLVAMFAVVSCAERLWTADEKDFVREIAVRARIAIERRRAEQALRELAASLELQVDRRLAERNRLWANARDLMALIDTEGVIAEVNAAWECFLGWETHELVGHPLFEFIDGEGAITLRQVLARKISQTQVETTLFTRDRKLRRIEWSISGEESVAYLVGRDVTEQQEIEARLRQSQKMEAIGQLTGGIAHDFNNLLAGITGSLDLLRIRLASNRRDGVERYIQLARTAAHRAAALTHRLLTFARQEPLDPKAVDVNQLVAGMEELLRRTLQSRIELELRLDATCPVMADPHQLENAILNLVINARDAMPRGGKIVVATEDGGPDRPAPAGPSGTPSIKGKFACVSVIDNGDGIPPEVVSKVFEPFFTTKPAGLGTGLGLSMIYGFIQQVGGDVALASEVGKGTTLRMYLPCAEQDNSQEAAPEDLPLARGHGERILVVEDDRAVRLTILEMLQELGYSPEGAEGPVAAMELLRSGAAVEVLITDWGLPGFTGGELAQLARKELPELPICFVTGYNAGDSELDALRPNETLVTKPVGIDVLARVVEAMLVRREPPVPQRRR